MNWITNSLVGVLAMSWLCSAAVPDVAASTSLYAVQADVGRKVPAAAPSQAVLNPELGPVAEQSFFAPESWAQELTFQQGWNDSHPRMLADVNGDGRQDVVGFGHHGVWLATSTGTSFSPAFVLLDFGYPSGWRVEKHVRTTGDINGDTRKDIVGFGNAGVYRALSTGTGFAPATFVVADFGYDQGWRVDKHVRLLADVNGDRRQDIVAFGDDGVWLSLASSSGFFSAPTYVLAQFGFNQGWTPAKHVRTTADLNGDGRQDIVGFGDHGVWTALSTGTGFGPAHFVLAQFGYIAGGWSVDLHPRVIADMDRDGKQDIVGFGDDGVWIARSTGNGFQAAQFVIANFGYHSGWRVGLNPRFVADLNGDGYQDIVGYGDEAVYRALGGAGGFDSPRAVLRDLVPAYGYDDLRFVGDVDGNHMEDLVAFASSGITVARSSDLPPPPPPTAPSNLRITGTTLNSLTVAWNDNSSDERRFFVIYGAAGGSTQTVAVGANVTTRVLSPLTQDTQYCFTVQAESVWDVSTEPGPVCGRTNRLQPLPPATRPLIRAAFEFFPGPELQILRILGVGFQPGEGVSLKITTQVGREDPFTVTIPAAADFGGRFDFTYGREGLVCGGQRRIVNVQATGHTSFLTSNIAAAGC